MGLFDRIKPSAPKHHFIDIIKYDGPNDILIWRHPNENFNNNAQLIVGPSQEVIFIKGGRVLDSVTQPGTYTLNSKNYPFIRSLVGLATGGEVPFSCTVYYVNKVISMGIEWGTDSPISIFEPYYGVPVDVTSYGDFSIRVGNGRKLMEKLVGQAQGFSQEEVTAFFSNLMAAQIRGVISQTMMERKLSPIGIDAHLVEISDAAAEKIRPVFEPYGLEVEHFVIGAISAPDLDSIKQKTRDLQEHRMETDVSMEDKRKMAQAQAFENKTLNVTEQEKWVGSAMGTLAGNPGPRMGGGGRPMPGMVGGSIIQPSAAGITDMARMLLHKDEPEDPGGDFSGTMPGGGMSGMMEEADSLQPAQNSFKEKADNIKYLLDSGMITQEQYQAEIELLLRENRKGAVL